MALEPNGHGLPRQLVFARESLEVLGVVGEVLVEDLDRDVPLELAVVGAEDARHAAGAAELLELVAVGDQVARLWGP